MTRILWVLGILGLIFVMAVSRCLPTAQQVSLTPTPEGATTVTNESHSEIFFDLLIARIVCTDRQCIYTTFYEKETLPPQTSKTYPFVEGETPPCEDVFCCTEGEMGTTEAILTLHPFQIVVTETLAWEACENG